MDDTAFLVPDIFAAYTDKIAFLQRHAGRQFRIVRHQNSRAIIELQKESFVRQSPGIIGQQARYPAADRQLNIALMVGLGGQNLGLIRLSG